MTVGQLGCLSSFTDVGVTAPKGLQCEALVSKYVTVEVPVNDVLKELSKRLDVR